MKDISVPIWQMVLLFTAPAVIGCALAMFWQYINEKLNQKFYVEPGREGLK